MISGIEFEGYKSFKKKQEFEFRPITVIFGKNSAGKSSLAKLPLLIESSLAANYLEPLTYSVGEIEFGAEYRDLFYNRDIQQQLSFKIKSKGNYLKAEVTNSVDSPIITAWEISKGVIFEDGVKLKLDDLKEKKSEFHGLIWDKYRDIISDNFQISVDYIGPFRLNPPRVFGLKSSSNFENIGVKGENAYQILIKNSEIARKVGDWYEKNFDGWRIGVNEIDPYYEIRISRPNVKGNGINLVDVGQGMSQALPIITRAFMQCQKNQLIVFEQPELHLHPAAHGNLGELLVSSWQDYGNKFLIETHSKNFILRLRTLIAKGKLKSEDFGLYYVKYNEEEQSSELIKINVNKNGEVDMWPDNVFDESYEEVKELMKAQQSQN